MSAGSAMTEKFNLGAATVMIGPKDQVLDLVPEKHSIGLVKNFSFSSNDQYLDLTQGIRNTVVYTVKTGSEVTASMEVYEYTSKNLAYALGLEGFELAEGIDMTLTENLNASTSTTTITTKAPAGATADDIVVGDYVTIQGNKYSNEDMVFVGKVSEVTFNQATAPEIATTGSIGDLIKAVNAQSSGLLTTNMGKLTVNAASNQNVKMSQNFATAFGFTGENDEATGLIKMTSNGSVTGTVSISRNNKLAGINLGDDETNIKLALDAAVVAEVSVKTNPSTSTTATYNIVFNRAIPEGFSFKEGDRVHKANLIPVGSAEAQPTLAAKVVGILPEDNKPITIIFPKIRITNGFNLGFQTDQYGTMPFEFTPFEQTPKDPLYNEYGDKGFAFLLD